MDKIVQDGVRAQQLRGKLYFTGWRWNEIEHLLQFLSTHPPTLEDLAGLDRKRLEFVRYLVQTGRIKDE